MNSFTRLCLYCFMMFSSALVLAENDAESVMNRADRLASLRDRIVADHASWSEEYAKEDTHFAKKQIANYAQFGKRVNAKSIPSASPLKARGVQVRFVNMSGLKRPGYEGDSSRSVLHLASGQLRAGPDVLSVKQASSKAGKSLKSLLAEGVRGSGDLAVLENSVLIPSGRYAKLGDANLQSYSGVDLSGQVKEHDPTCMLRKGEVLIIETTQKKYALVQYLGKYQEQVLLCVAYQPNGSAVFEFGPLLRPKEVNYAEADINPQDLAVSMFVHNRETFFWKEVKALTGQLKNMEKDARLSQKQQQDAKQIKKKLGITK